MKLRLPPRIANRFKLKHKNIKETMEYEQIPPDRSRTKFIPEEDRGIEFDRYSGIRSSRLVLDRKLRQGTKILKLGVRKVTERIADGWNNRRR